ncbi:hypothetical protein HHK36_002876 [Tetracentron sinense]|uniref:Uncharacterized protein n=1 Tax=Tetracentron sinense TaxID=13715 RepID=A0A834ZSB7_TETSI|nr:hypothetical protein HHK36_002876 [Tetracentron sinense]
MRLNQPYRVLDVASLLIFSMLTFTNRSLSINALLGDLPKELVTDLFSLLQSYDQGERRDMGGLWITFGIICLISFIQTHVSASKAACHDPFYGVCYGIPHTCPSGCPRLCEVDCRLCKPYCACDKPGAVCQDPRFIGGDGVMFYFHGKKDKDFCLVSDPDIHVNAHFIGKRSNKGRDFTWVQSIGILFESHQLYLGALKVAQWDELVDNMLIQLDGEDIVIPAGRGKSWWSPEAGLKLRRHAEANAVEVQVEGLFEIKARVVPITSEESKVHGYDVAEDDCFPHLELNFKFNSLSHRVNGVLGQTYRPSFRSRVKMAAAMPIMGGAEKFAVSQLFATDCVVSNFGFKMEAAEGGQPLNIACGSGDGRKGIVCRK